MTTPTIDRQAVGVDCDSLTLSDVLGAGFPSRDLIPAAIALLPGHSLPGVPVPVTPRSGLSEAAGIMLPGRTGVGQHEGPHGSVRLAAGTIALVARDEARAERVRAWHRLPIVSVDPETGEIRPGRRGRGRISEWSPKSRANMVRQVASADWRPFFRAGFGVMVTLTYPGPWHLFCPSRAVLARHMEAFKERHRKAFGPVLGSWKVEYQDRGAPHVHLFLPMPHRLTMRAYREWCRQAWNSVIMRDRRDDFLRLAALVGATNGPAVLEDHAGRHLRAGVSVDEREGARCRDPRRLAVYFLGHSLKHKDGKEYQHRLPASFAGRAGRWWGLWGVEVVVGTAYLDVRTWVSLRRLMRRWAKANRRRAFAGGRMFGGWVSVNDGPAMLSQLARALAIS